MFSYLVAAPSAIKVFNWTATLYKGSITFSTPMLYAFGFIGLFTMGGLTGLFVAALGIDVHVEQGDPVTDWGRLIFYVADVDEAWRHLKEHGFQPGTPRDASWGERYFHVLDPDGHELSFARRLRPAA